MAGIEGIRDRNKGIRYSKKTNGERIASANPTRPTGTLSKSYGFGEGRKGREGRGQVSLSGISFDPRIKKKTNSSRRKKQRDAAAGLRFKTGNGGTRGISIFKVRRKKRQGSPYRATILEHKF